MRCRRMAIYFLFQSRFESREVNESSQERYYADFGPLDQMCDIIAESRRSGFFEASCEPELSAAGRSCAELRTCGGECDRQ